MKIMQDQEIKNADYETVKKIAVSNCLENDFCTGFHIMRKRNTNDWTISYKQSLYTKVEE